MGKSKKKSRASAKRLNPLGNRKGTDNSAVKDAATVTKRIQPLLDNLQSVVPNDRSMALSSISVLCEDPHIRQLLLKEKLVHIILTKLLSDENADIVVEAYGLLRNISLEEGYDVSTHLWRSDIWISILAGFEKIEESLRSINDDDKKSTTESKRMLFDFTDNLLSLVVALSNGSDDILKQVLKEDKLNRLFQIIITLLQFGYSKLPIQLFNTILDLIYDFSSESFEFIEEVTNNSFLSEFVKSLPGLVKQDETLNELSQVLVQGIYLQFLDMEVTHVQANEIIHTVCQTIDKIDLVQVQEDISVLEKDDELANSPDADVASKIKDYTKKRNLALMRFQSVEISIDLMTAITEIVAALYEENKKVQLPDQLIITLIEYLPYVFRTLSQSFTSRILIAWNNLLWLYITLGISIFEMKYEPYKQLWEFINSIEDLQKVDLGVKIGRLSVVWAILKTISLENSPTKYLEILKLSNNLDFVNSVIQEYNAASQNKETTEDFIELKQRCCGVLGTYATIQGQIPVNSAIGKFFITQLVSTETPQLLLIEITNIIFEIYPDSAFDYDEPVFVQQEFLKALKDQVVPNLRNRFKLVDKNKDPELKERCNKCFTTLDSFIHYKEDNRS